MIEIKVNGQIVSVQQTEPLYSGSADVQKCRFIFDKSWNGFEKSAVFRVGADAHTKLLDGDGCCTLPWELLTHRRIGRQLEVGVYGVSADAEILTGVWDTLGVIREGAEPGEDTRAPGESVYDQIMARLKGIAEKVSGYDDGVLALTQRAETAAGLATESAQSAAEDLEELRELVETHQGVPGDTGPQGPAGAAGPQGPKGDSLNLNLLHNWYFASCVNQRGQTVYTTTGYTIDKWNLMTGSTNIEIRNDGISIIGLGSGSSQYTAVRQYIECPEKLYGKTITVSMLLSDGSFAWKSGTVPTVLPELNTTTTAAIARFDGDSERYVALLLSSDGRIFFQMRGPKAGETTIAAVKLELGDTQTLAHQDENGNWVLNEIPDYGAELLKCQRYYQIFSSEAARPTALADYRPSMRATPATGTIDIGGVTHYYADANL